MHFVEMLNYCCRNTSKISSDPRVNNISRIVLEIKKEKEQIQLLQKQKKLLFVLTLVVISARWR